MSSNTDETTESLDYEFEATMFDNGRITIKKSVREKLKLEKGTRLRLAVLKVLDKHKTGRRKKN